MKKIFLALGWLLLAVLFVLAQGPQTVTCPIDGGTAKATGRTRTNQHPPPILECEYQHGTHSFWLPCGS